MSKENPEFNYWSFNCSVGSKNHVNQDYSMAICDPLKKFAIALISDGHGDYKHFRSGIGAKLAVEVSAKIIRNVLVKEGVNSVGDVYNLAKTIKTEWNNSINNHYKNNDFNEKEEKIISHLTNLDLYSIYGTTLNIFVVTPKYWFAIKCGDGEIVILDLIDEHIEIKYAIKNDNIIANYTDSLCNDTANLRVKYQVLNNDTFFVAALLMTDGVTNSFDETGLNEFILYLMKTQYKNRKNDNRNENQDEDLVKYLRYVSDNGSEDDISVAGIFRESKFESK